MKFGRRSGSQSTSIKCNGNGSSSSLASSPNNGSGGTLSETASSTPTPATRIFSSSLPTRKQRMLLLKCIIHNADAVQKQYLVPKQVPSTTTPKPNGSIFVRADTATAEINDKCYQRWHQVLQEGLVPMSVHALNLLEKTVVPTGGRGATDDGEEAYLATMEGMDEEIRVMAVLARAAALDDLPVGRSGGGGFADEDGENGQNGAEDHVGTERIDDMMKCSAVLLFHIVLATFAPESRPGSVEEGAAGATKNGTAETGATAAGYDGRVRHVMKCACVDVLTHAILESVESFDGRDVGAATDEGDEPSGVRDADERSSWNMANIKTFLDQTDLGKDAIFGTPSKSNDTRRRREKGPRSEADEETANSGDASKQSQPGQNGHVTIFGEMPSKTTGSIGSTGSICSIGSIGSIDSTDLPSSLEVQMEKRKDPETQSVEETPQEEADVGDRESRRSEDQRGNEDQASETSVDEDLVDVFDGNHGEEEQGKEGRESKMAEEIHARRRFNAKFLATRKFELIERLVAIDIVRFLMAEEREKKLRENDSKLRGKNDEANKTTWLRKGKDDAPDSNDEVGTVDLGDSDRDENADSGSEPIANAGSQYFTASRVNQIKRGAKIAGAGLAIGTVFAITGGLAAPALAAGIGSIAALTGASAASSATVLAVLATFKAGAALFGVGGGGLAAYRMKKRTAGLTQFEIRRENIEQYMHAGASEEKMKKGIEAMLPQLHTTVVVSGWLRHNDTADFQLPWGIQPTCKYEDAYDDQLRIRQMKRFYAVYNPPLAHLCESFMRTLQKRLKKDFSWDRIWNSLEHKYGANPDHMIPIDTPFDGEVFLSREEKEMIDGVLSNAKIVKSRISAGDGIDFNEHDEIAELLAEVSPQKPQRKNSIGIETELDTMENELVTLENELALDRSDCLVLMNDQADERKTGMVVKEIEMSDLSVQIPNDDGGSVKSQTSPTLKERMAKQRGQQVSFLKNKGLLGGESNLQEGAGSPKMAGTDSALVEGAHDPPVKNEERDKKYEDKRCPVVWDWKRLYGTADIHTVTWESQMLSSLCHIVENFAMEVSTQATKVALQYSVIGAIISAIMIPSALITASKLIDDPYQIVVLRADEAGKELANCLLLSNERRPVTLVGFSFGARVVYSCLRELARQQEIWEENRASKSNGTAEQNKSSRSPFLSKKSKEERGFEYDREPASLVGDVIFIGLPRAIDRKILTSCRRVTGGRFVNCYTTNDWLLSLMFVARGGTPCGTKPIKNVPGVENYDVTGMVESHTQYGDAIPNILQHIRFSEP